MKVDGRCHCGHVTYQAEIAPGRMSICHCTDCQQLAGSAFRVTATVPPRGVPADRRRSALLYQGCGQRQATAAVLLPGMRLSDLHHRRGRGDKGDRHPRRHREPARPVDPDIANLVRLCPAMAGRGPGSSRPSPRLKSLARFPVLQRSARGSGPVDAASASGQGFGYSRPSWPIRAHSSRRPSRKGPMPSCSMPVATR